MLKRFHITNFKSLVNSEFQPAGVNLLVGPNNAGKTNLCQALRFLSSTASMPLDKAVTECVSEPWNLLNVHQPDETCEIHVLASLRMQEETVDYAYSLKIRAERTPGPSPPTFEVVNESLRASGDGFDDVVLLENVGSQVRVLHRPTSAAELGSMEYGALPPETNHTVLCRLSLAETWPRTTLFKNYLTSWRYHSFSPQQMRQREVNPMDRALTLGGSNLSSVLYTLHNERPRDMRQIIEQAREIDPRLDTISFQSPDPNHVYMFFEDKDGHRFGTHNISDGTLRFLAISVALSPIHSPDGAIGPPLTIIEEPENGLYVGHLKQLFNRIDLSGGDGQFIFTSHNPYFIDLFDGVLDGLHVVTNDGTSTSISKPDGEKVRQLLEKFPLGEMHFRGLLSRNRSFEGFYDDVRTMSNRMECAIENLREKAQ